MVVRSCCIKPLTIDQDLPESSAHRKTSTERRGNRKSVAWGAVVSKAHAPRDAGASKSMGWVLLVPVSTRLAEDYTLHEMPANLLLRIIRGRSGVS